MTLHGRRPAARRVRGVTVATMVAASACLAVAQSRETLETEVSVTADEITFKWSKKHPWDAALIANGASLYGEYRTARGAGLECLQPRTSEAPATGRRSVGGSSSCYAGNPVFRAEDRAIVFRLPQNLTAEPLGPVCLQIRLPDQRLVPLRRATRVGDDTARFQVEEWARNAAARARGARLERQLAELRSAIAVQAGEIAEQAQANDGKGWTSADACRSVTAGTVEVAGSGRPVAPADQQDGVARQVCVARVGQGKGNVGRVQPPEVLPNLTSYVDQPTLDRWLRLRGAQLNQFMADWKMYGERVNDYRRAYPVPHFGNRNDTIPIQSLAALAGGLVTAAAGRGEPVEGPVVLGFVGANLEAYDRCVRDGKQQLQLNFAEARALQATLDTLPERLRQQAVQACQAGVTRLASMRTTLDGFTQQAASAERALSDISFVTLSRRSRDVNAVACMP